MAACSSDRRDRVGTHLEQLLEFISTPIIYISWDILERETNEPDDRTANPRTG